MKITLDIKKSVEENAQAYFEKAKKLKKKAHGAREAVELHKQKLANLTVEDEKAEERARAQKEKRSVKREYYERFRWFISSEGYLCMSGIDASTNEAIVKRHTEDTEVLLHTEMAGSPFTVVKCGKNTPGEITLNEAAQFTQAYSRGWKNGLSTMNVFHVAPEQVSKTPNPGEFVPKGSFIIRGSVTYMHPTMEICVGVAKDGPHKGRVIAGSRSVMKQHATQFAILKQGDTKQSDLAKTLAKKFELKEAYHLDDLIKFIPAGGAQVAEYVSS